MLARKPDFRLDEGNIIWSRIPEFSMVYNSAGVIIPYVEHYLNKVIMEVMHKHCEGKPELKEDLDIFTVQEAIHASLHKQFNKRMFEAGFDELKPLIDEAVADLEQLRKTRSLAFNTAYCAGFETIATFGSKYLYEQCDDYLAGTEKGSNLILWHVAEEFEHRAVCHDAFSAVSGNYFMRVYGLVYAFLHVGGFFRRSEAILLKHYWKDLSAAERKTSQQRSNKIFWRQMFYLLPRMIRIVLPGYNPASLPVPPRVQAALDYFQTSEPITRRYDPALGREVG